MRIEAELCHIDHQRCVVKVSGWDGDKPLGSALGEGQTSVEAEERALERLSSRLTKGMQSSHSDSRSVVRQDSTNEETVRSAGQASDASTAVAKNPVLKPSLIDVNAHDAHMQVSQMSDPAILQADRLVASKPSQQTLISQTSQRSPASRLTKHSSQGQVETSADQSSEAPMDPEDWSDELAAIDLQLQRIGWDRDQERVYLTRAFGHGSRHKLTRYADLVAFLKRLESLSPGSLADQTPVPVRRSDLLGQCDQLIQQLSWSAEQGKKLLQEHLGVDSRQQLSDEQLLKFNMILEGELINRSQ